MLNSPLLKHLHDYVCNLSLKFPLAVQGELFFAALGEIPGVLFTCSVCVCVCVCVCARARVCVYVCILACMCVCEPDCTVMCNSAIPWIVAGQAPLSGVLAIAKYTSTSSSAVQTSLLCSRVT